MRLTYEEECIDALHEECRQKLARLCLAGYRFHVYGVTREGDDTPTGNFAWRVTRPRYDRPCHYGSLMVAVEREWEWCEVHQEVANARRRVTSPDAPQDGRRRPAGRSN